MARTNKVVLVVGTRGTGKTDFTKNVLRKSNFSKKLVVDTLDSPIWRDLNTHDNQDGTAVNVMPLDKLRAWNSGIYRIFSSDTAEMMEAVQTHVFNAFIVFEDATKYIGSKLTDDVRKFVLDSKQKNLDLLFIFHSIAQVPLDLARVSDILVLFKTNEKMTSSLKNRIPVPNLESAHKKVNESKNQYENTAMYLN